MTSKLLKIARMGNYMYQTSSGIVKNTAVHFDNCKRYEANERLSKLKNFDRRPSKLYYPNVRALYFTYCHKEFLTDILRPNDFPLLRRIYITSHPFELDMMRQMQYVEWIMGSNCIKHKAANRSEKSSKNHDKHCSNNNREGDGKDLNIKIVSDVALRSFINKMKHCELSVTPFVGATWDFR